MTTAARAATRMSYDTTLKARIGVSFALECRNDAGELLKTIQVNGEIPLEEAARLGLPIPSEKANGQDDHQ